MRIGIDVSQIIYEGTGVGRYVRKLVTELVRQDKKNTYILFGSTARQQEKIWAFVHSCQEISPRVIGYVVPFPIGILEFLWNKLHIIPIEWFLGNIDVFWSSDWVQPPLAHAVGCTTIHDLTVYRYPESFAEKIVNVHKAKLARSVHECSVFFCDSEATREDAQSLLSIPKERLCVVYPGFGGIDS